MKYPKPTEPGCYYFGYEFKGEFEDIIKVTSEGGTLYGYFHGDDEKYHLDRLPGPWGPRVTRPDDFNS